MTTRDDLEQITASLFMHATDLVRLSATNPELVKQDAAIIHATYTKLAIVLDALELVPARGASRPKRVVA